MAKIIKTWHSENIIASQYYVNENGVRNGDSRTWNSNGNLETQCGYVDGKIVGTKKFFGQDGKVEREIDYDFDGSAFVIKFYADEWTIQAATAMGLTPEVEDLTLDKMLSAFDEVRNQRDEFKEKLLQSQENQKEQTLNKELPKSITTMYDSNRVTFT
jgi:hypothetical protein